MVFYFESECKEVNDGTNEETKLDLSADLMTFTKFVEFIDRKKSAVERIWLGELLCDKQASDQEVTRKSQVIDRIYICHGNSAF